MQLGPQQRALALPKRREHCEERGGWLAAEESRRGTASIVAGMCAPRCTIKPQQQQACAEPNCGCLR